MTEINGRPMPADPGCFWHGEEPITPDAFRVCFECGHVYATREEIVTEHRAAFIEVYPDRVSSADEAAEKHAENFCPMCLHDW